MEYLFQRATNISQRNSTEIKRTLRHKKLGVMFFQPSTRTRLSFEAAALGLGGKVLGFADARMTRSGDFFKESLEDAVQVVGRMVDCIVMRHYEPGSSERASQACSVPVINGGDGSNEHPTQALSDLWTMHTHLGGLDGVRVGLVGDAGTRTLRSIVIGLSKFNPKEILFLLPPSTELPKNIISILSAAGISYQRYQDISDVLKDADAVEILPIHLPNLESSKDDGTSVNLVTPDCYRITKGKIIHTNSSAYILHPGPRLDELSRDTDLLPQALFFKQVSNGVFMRMILLEEVMDASK